MDKDQIKADVHQYYSTCFEDKSGRYVRMQELLPTIDSNGYILDYGCGLGCVSHFFSNKYRCNIDAVDYSRTEVDKAKIAWGDDCINFQTITEFDFPESKYDLIFSSQVIEHVHNVGNYLFQINKMLRPNGSLVIGLPNIITHSFIAGTFFISTEKLIRHSKNILDKYDKTHHHIGAWDARTFVTLLASCGFEVEKYIPMEGVPQPAFIWKRIPFIGRYFPDYTNKMNRGFSGNFSYTMYFRFRKVKNVVIREND